MAAMVYCISAAEDGDFLKALRDHTAVLQQSGSLTLHHRDSAPPGSAFDDDGPVAQAQAVLVLLTRNLFGDANAMRQVSQALERKKLVVPLRARPCMVKGSGLEHLSALPRGGDWLESADNDKAWLSVCEELKKLLGDLPAPETVRALLPLEPNCLGREEDLQKLVAQLASSEPSIILGGAGLGKTTLLVKALHDPTIAELYGARRYFVRCDTATTCDGVVQEVAKLLCVPSSAHIEQVVLDHLSKAKTLLALDNAETPWEADRGPFEELLRALASACKLVLTLRGAKRPAHLRFQTPLTPQKLEVEHARQVFLEIAGEKHDRDPLLDRLIEAVDRLPLALTLLAYRAEVDRNLSFVWDDWQKQGTAAMTRGDDKQDNLDRSLTLSIKGPSMRACPAALRLLRLLGFLPDGIDWDDLETLLPGESREADRTLRGVGLADEGAVLKVLAPVREHARRYYPLDEGDEDRALRLYLPRAVEQGARIGRPGGSDASKRLLAEAGNIEAVVAQALERGRCAEAVAALSAFAKFAYAAGYRGRVVELLQAAAAKSRDDRDRAWCQRRLGDMEFQFRLGDHGKTHYTAARDHFQRVGDLLGQAKCVRSLGDLAARRCSWSEAREHYEAAVALFHKFGDDLGQANHVLRLGELDLKEERKDEARARFEIAIPLFEKVADPLGQARCIRSLGNLALHCGNLNEAHRRYEAALPLFEEVGSFIGQASCRKGLGYVARRRGDRVAARSYFEAALVIYQNLGDRDGQDECTLSLAEQASRL